MDRTVTDMARPDIDINSVLETGRWQSVQDNIARAFGLAVVTVDYKGSPITGYSGCSVFCEKVMNHSVYRKRCFKCCALAGLEAARLKKAYICLCHCGLLEAAVPVMAGDSYLGAVLLGQARPTDSRAERLLNESTVTDLAESVSDINGLLNKLGDLPAISVSRLEEITGLVSSVVRYIVEKSIDAQTELQTYEWMLRRAMPEQQNAKSSRTNAPLLRSSEAVPDPSSAGDPKIAPGNPGYPAINYVETHRHQMVGMREMAALCHLSPSYFSKLFLREIGENFTDWVNRRKISWAKELLRDTGTSITSIGTSLGFMDTSYFIKVFKKFEGITPLVYRQHKYR